MKVAVILLFLFFMTTHQNIFCKKDATEKGKDNGKKKEKDLKIGKKVNDYNDRDIHKLLDQWNENDDDYEEEEDDNPMMKPKPKIDMEKILSAGGNKEDIIMASKKGQPLMIFANVAGNPTRAQTEKASGFWQQSLQNAQIQAQRYVVSDNRVLFQLNDGSLAFKVKDFLVDQHTCESVSFENMDFPGKGKGREKFEL